MAPHFQPNKINSHFHVFHIVQVDTLLLSSKLRTKRSHRCFFSIREVEKVAYWFASGELLTDSSDLGEERMLKNLTDSKSFSRVVL